MNQKQTFQFGERITVFACKHHSCFLTNHTLPSGWVKIKGNTITIVEKTIVTVVTAQVNLPYLSLSLSHPWPRRTGPAPNFPWSLPAGCGPHGAAVAWCHRPLAAPPHSSHSRSRGTAHLDNTTPSTLNHHVQLLIGAANYCMSTLSNTISTFTCT